MKPRKTKSRLLIGVLGSLTTLQPVIQASSSLPTGGTFAAGSGSFSVSGNTLTINQNAARGIINWNTFSIANGATVSFKNGSGATLNRVTGGAPSSVLGQLLATGNVYLLNPQGVLIGHGAAVHTGGDFLASTLSVSNATFLRGGSLTFGGSSTATVVNLGNISSNGGSIYLIGNSVQNDGTVSASQGTAALAAGSRVFLATDATGPRVSVTAPGGDVTNTGLIAAAQAELRTNGGNIYALAGNNGGQINATGTATRDGHVWLVAANGTTNVSGLITAANADGTGGSIETSGARVSSASALIKTGRNGNWLLDPDDLTIDSTLAGTIETSLNGGTNVTEQTSAPTSGGFGDITVASNIAWTSGANLTLSAYRDINVNTGTTISNTGAGNLTLRADNASNGAGAVNINGLVDFSGSTGNVAMLYNPTGTESTKYTTPVSYSIGTSGTQVLTNSAWVAPTDLSVSSQATAYMLVNNVTDIQNISTALAGTYALGADVDASSVPNFTPLATSSSFTGIFDGQGHTISKLTINDTTHANIGLFGQSSGKIRNVNLTSESLTATVAGGDNDIGGLVGDNNGTVANISVSGTVSVSNGVTGGYNFEGGAVGWNQSKVMGATTSATVTAANIPGPDWAGDLVGVNLGQLSSSGATGSVTITSPTGNDNTFSNHIGGLSAYNSSTVADCFSSATVSLDKAGTSAYSDSFTPSAGGLIGLNQGTITNSYSTGSVTGGPTVFTGGLVGNLGGSVTSSYSVGSITGPDAEHTGGFAGKGGGTITNSYWDTQASGQTNAAGNGATLDGLTGLTTAQLKSGSLQDGFLSTHWYANAGEYPFLLWQGRAISGTVYDGSVLAGATVDALVQGVNIGSTTSNGSGFYSFFLPVGTFAGASGVLTYLTSPVTGNTFSDGDGTGNYTGMNIYAGTLQLMNRNSTTYSGMLAALGSALGNYSNPNLLFALNSGSLSLNPQTNLTINSIPAVLLDSAISVPTGMLTIQSNGAITQSQPITAASTSLTASSVTLTNSANSLGALAAITTGNLNVTNSGDLSLSNIASGGTVAVQTSGTLSLAANSSVTANGSGDALILATGNAFSNQSGASALSVTGGGRWLVYSQNPSNDTVGGLSEDFVQYNAQLGVTTPAQSSGNGLLYTLAPVVTAGLTGTISKNYDGTDSATLTAANFTTNGAVQGDSVVLTFPSAGTYASVDPGTGIDVTATGISLVSTSRGSIPVYGYQLGSSTATGAIGAIISLTPPPPPAPPAPTEITIDINNVTRLQNQSNPAFSAVYGGPAIDGLDIASILASLTYTTTASTASAPGLYQVIGSIVAPSGYTVNIIPGTLTVLDSTPHTLPSQANLTPPLLPPLVTAPNSMNLLQPTNSLGFFDITVQPGSAGLPLAGTPLSESSFFGIPANQTDAYVAGVKP